MTVVSSVLLAAPSVAMFTFSFVNQNLEAVYTAFSFFHPVIFRDPYCYFRRFNDSDKESFEVLFRQVRYIEAPTPVYHLVFEPVSALDYYYR